MIYNDIIALLPPWEVGYDEIVESFKESPLEESKYFNGVFQEFKKLGGNQVFFVKADSNGPYRLNKQSTFIDYFNTINGKLPMFDVKLLDNEM